MTTDTAPSEGRAPKNGSEAGGDPVSYFRVYVSTSGSASSFRMAGTTARTEILLGDLALTVGLDYFTYVTAVGEGGAESGPSETISVGY